MLSSIRSFAYRAQKPKQSFRLYCNHAQSSPLNELWPPKTSGEPYESLKFLVDKMSTAPRVPFKTRKDGTVDSHRFDLIANRSNPDTVVREFEKNYSPDSNIAPAAFVKVILAYGKVQQAHRALEIFSKHVSNGFEPHLTHLSALLGAFGRSGDLPAALTLFSLIWPKSTSPIPLTSIIDAASHANEVDLAFQVWEESMKTPNGVTLYVNLFTALSEAAIAAQRFELFEKCENDLYRRYHEALKSGNSYDIASLQYTPKHVMIIATMLKMNWLSTLEDMPKDSKGKLIDELAFWENIRPCLPGFALTKEEIADWEDCVSGWFEVQKRWGKVTPTGLDRIKYIRESNNQSSHL